MFPSTGVGSLFPGLRHSSTHRGTQNDRFSDVCFPFCQHSQSTAGRCGQIKEPHALLFEFPHSQTHRHTIPPPFPETATPFLLDRKVAILFPPPVLSGLHRGTQNDLFSCAYFPFCQPFKSTARQRGHFARNDRHRHTSEFACNEAALTLFHGVPKVYKANDFIKQLVSTFPFHFPITQPEPTKKPTSVVTEINNNT